MSTGAALDEIAECEPESIIAELRTSAGPAIVHDATVSEEFHHGLLSLIASDATLPISENGKSTEAVEHGFIQPSSMDAEPPVVRRLARRSHASSAQRSAWRHGNGATDRHSISSVSWSIKIAAA